MKLITKWNTKVLADACRRAGKGDEDMAPDPEVSNVAAPINVGIAAARPKPRGKRATLAAAVVSAPLLRSNVEFAKRVFLDRLSVDAQPLLQPNLNIDIGPGDLYDWGGTYDPFDLGVGADCSGGSGIWIGASLLGPTGMNWGRQFSTYTFPGPFQGFQQVPQQELLTGNYPIKVCIHNGASPEDSHMNTWIDGWLMESNGDDGTCTLNVGAINQDSSYWNDWWVYTGTITEDTPYRQTMGYPRGLDYAGGRPAGADLLSAGITFVCRYLTDGGSSLPGKLLVPAEYEDLMSHGISVVFNYETTADFMMTDSGSADAQQALATIRGLPQAPQQPVVYFSADFDEAPDQQNQINQFLIDAGTVLGTGNVGIYGAYYVCKRALDAGVASYMWQTEAWSGFDPQDEDNEAPHIDSRVNIMQRNNIGYQYVDGVECDINEARSGNYGQVLPWATQPVPPITTKPPVAVAVA
ncbi:MAG: DUF1906 domain-containing protein [Mycobacterium sp.]|nr:DUF1906 domain-containing protein [Mycobacterium sp.]